MRNVILEADRGIILLSGMVNTLYEKNQVTALIKTVQGVRGVIDYTVLAPMDIPDNDIRNEIEVSFLHDPSVYAPRIDIDVSEGVVTLSGSVANAWEKREALCVAQGVVGVLAVRDELVVDDTISLSGPERMAALEAMLKADEYLFDNALTVTCKDGRVILRGTVDAAFEKARAEGRIASLGIEACDNRLDVCPVPGGYERSESASLKDAQIEKAIREIIRMDERLHPLDCEFLIEEGCVTLQGTIQDIYQKWFLEQDILNVCGVQFVYNGLTPRTETRQDKDISRDVERTLHSLLGLARADAGFACKGGEVVLDGTVSNVEGKILMEGIVERIAGVKTVVSHLRIEYPRVSPTAASVQGNDPSPAGLINWSMDVGNSAFRICVDRQRKTITITGEANDQEQKYRAENLIRLRAPDNFSIINDIRIAGYF
ncbi:MAG: BON domain-containing protein [bacterium]